MTPGRDEREIAQALAATLTPIAFDNVCRHRVRGSANLRAQFETLEAWKRYDRQPVDPNEEIVSTLPGDERVMPEIHGVDSVQRACHDQSGRAPAFWSPFLLVEHSRLGTAFPSVKDLPVLPFLPLLPFPPLLPFLPFLPQ